MRIGSNEHKELFCRSFIESHEPYDPRDWPWPQLDEISLARLRAIPIWTAALEVAIGAGAMLAGFAKREPDALVRHALELQGYEEARHARMLECLVERYGLTATPQVPQSEPTRRAFIDFGYNECVDGFASFGVYRLARETKLFPETLISLFTHVITEEARQIVFFINWVAWDRCRRELQPFAQTLAALDGYTGAIARRIAYGAEMRPFEPPRNLTPPAFLRACILENDRCMAQFDPRLLRPQVIPSLAKLALALAEVAELARPSTRSARSG